jgi:Raf kinase inhibitor-like YbhB/YbcL family protein
MLDVSMPSIDVMKLDIQSKSFMYMAEIPRKHTCDGANINPALDIAFLPNKTETLAIIVEDPDAPINTWVHWLVWNLPPIHHIPEHCKMGVQGMNDFSKHYYCGPCPLIAIHRYHFKVYALDIKLDLKGLVRVNDLKKAMKNHVIAYGELIGIYGK